ncbi:hypothetical protein SKAU_G00213330 [Synaphobranchus kaupii]|uniref:Uncharacterized protein n=1 Tax=Synaphobranchus kaupii TaxID=118154 RepID=A0A9Q1F9W1_SYNKA|nr:hypothetical protein SKAU_G00213330 [Synaphobranchus kaupii]
MGNCQRRESLAEEVSSVPLSESHSSVQAWRPSPPLPPLLSQSRGAVSPPPHLPTELANCPPVRKRETLDDNHPQRLGEGAWVIRPARDIRPWPNSRVPAAEVPPCRRPLAQERASSSRAAPTDMLA